MDLNLPKARRNESRENQGERIYIQIRQALMSGAYEPGQRITVASLASALDVSAMPVRQAIRRLAAERALEMQPNRSVTVPRLTRTEVLRLRELRSLLEGYAAAQAARSIDSATLNELAQLQIAISSARSRSDGKAIMRYNEEFHFKVYNAAKVPTLIDLISVLWLHSAPTMNIMFKPEYLSRYPAKSQTENNLRLIKALRRGLADEAANAVKAEIELGSRILDEIMRDIEDQGANGTID